MTNNGKPAGGWQWERVLHGIADVSLFTRELADLANRQNADNAFQLIGIHLVADAGPWVGFKDRFPWLLATVGSGTMGAFLAGLFEATLERALRRAAAGVAAGEEV